MAHRVMLASAAVFALVMGLLLPTGLRGGLSCLRLLRLGRGPVDARRCLGRADPGGVPGALSWDVLGALGKSSGVWLD